MKRLLVALVAGVVVFVAVYAAAAGVALRELGLGASQDPVLSCDSHFSFSFTLDSASAVTAVTVGDIAPECAGGALSLTLTNGSNTSIASGEGTVPAGGGSLVVSVTPHPSNVDVAHEHVAIVGP